MPRAVPGRVFFALDEPEMPCNAAVTAADQFRERARRLLALLQCLRTPERAFVLVSRQMPLMLANYKKDGNAAFVRALERIDTWLDCARLVTAIASPPPSEDARSSLVRFRISLKLRGRNTLRYHVEELSHLAARTLGSMLGWVHDPRTHDVEVQVHLSDTAFTVGFPLPATVLPPRPSHYGLRPTTAACLVHLAALLPGHVLLDPMCGTGTIVHEAAQCRGVFVVGGDRSAACIQAAQCTEQPSNVAWHVGNATCVPMRNHSLDAIVTDMPFDRQHVLDTDISQLINEWVRLLRPGGRMVLLTCHPTEVTASLASHGMPTATLPLRLGSLEAHVVLAGPITPLARAAAETWAAH